MPAQIRAELLKLTTVRTSLLFALVTAGFVVMVVSIQAVTAGSEFMGPLSDEATQRSLFLTAGAAPLIAIVFGCLAISSELRHHTIVSTLLFEPARTRVVAAKAVAILIAGAVLGAIAVVSAIGSTSLILLATGTEGAIDASTLVASTGGTLGSTALGALFGMGIGGIVRHQAAAVGAVLILMLAVEPLITSLLPDVGPWLPSALITVIAEARTGGEIAVGLAAALLGGYALLATVGATITLRRSDIT